MSQFENMFAHVKNNDNFEENARLMQYAGNMLKHMTKLPASESDYIRNFTVSEMDRLIKVIPQTQSYAEKDKMFFYEDSLLMVFTLAGGNFDNISEKQIETVKQLVTLVDKERFLEKAVDEMFELEKIEKGDIDKVLEIVKPIKDDYQRGMLFQGLLAHKDKIKNLNADAKTALAEYTADETEKLLKKADKLNSTDINNLEISADVCKYFISDRLLKLLLILFAKTENCIRYYALETLLENNVSVSTEPVKALAEDLTYAQLTHDILNKFGKGDLFPKELSTPEYLAKSDMAHWLTYPTELGKLPDEIELLGSIKVKKELYYVFKYKSDSGNLSDDLVNEWLIGWSNDNGNTFSNFDRLVDYEKKTVQKTVKNIAKKLLK